jgi:hypothetical protein
VGSLEVERGARPFFDGRLILGSSAAPCGRGLSIALHCSNAEKQGCACSVYVHLCFLLKPLTDCGKMVTDAVVRRPGLPGHLGNQQHRHALVPSQAGVPRFQY